MEFKVVHMSEEVFQNRVAVCRTGITSVKMFFDQDCAWIHDHMKHNRGKMKKVFKDYDLQLKRISQQSP